MLREDKIGIVFSRMVRILNLSVDFWRIYPSNVIFEESEGFLFEVSTWMDDHLQTEAVVPILLFSIF